MNKENRIAGSHIKKKEKYFKYSFEILDLY